jgi:3-dehydroquinate dehydratase/shikimate dehydrogenase
VVGLGKPGVMLTVLGKKIGAPWAYAALERGMEAYPGQPTVEDLNDVYRYGEIDSSTRLLGVTGFGDREYAAVSVLNAAMKHLELPVRCLPMGVGSVRLFRKIAEAVKLAGLVIDDENQEAIVEMVGEQHETVQQAKAANLVVYKGDKWHGFHTAAPAAVPALAAALKSPAAGDAPLKGKFVALVGLNGTTRAVGAALVKQGAAVIIVSHNKKDGQQLASELGCRYQHFAALYSTAHEVLVVCGPDQEADRGGTAEVHPGYLRDSMTVMDLTATLRLSPLLREAASRGCSIVGPRKLFLEQMGMLARMMTGKQVPREVLEAGIPRVLREEE